MGPRSWPDDEYLQTSSCPLSVPKNTTARKPSVKTGTKCDNNRNLLVRMKICTDKMTSRLLIWKPGWP